MDPLRDNPFFVLELKADATPLEVERQGRKLIGMIELGLARATTVNTPLGPRPRSVVDVREAMQVLLDPVRRLPFEPWAAAPSSTSAVLPSSATSAATSASMPLPDIGGVAWWQR